MYVICLVFVLTMAVVQCTDPTCTTSTCTGDKTCKWICEKDGHQIAYANSTVCTAPAATCATTGSCRFACEAALVAATCTPNPCPGGKPCKWTCEKSDHTPVVDAYITACTSKSGPCGSAADSGTCKTECVQTPVQPIVTTPAGKTGGSTGITTTAAGTTCKNGSIRLGVSPLMLLCGLFTKLFLYP